MRPVQEDQLMRVPRWLADALVMIVIFILTALPGPMQPHAGNPEATWVVPLAGVIAAGLIPFRHRFPTVTLALALALYLGAVAQHFPALGPGAAVAVLAFTVAEQRPPRWALPIGGLATLAIGAESVLVSTVSTFEPQVFMFAAATAVATALGDSTRSRRDYAASMRERAERAERSKEAEALRRVAEERLRIAQDLHDTVAHRISIISLNAGVASAALERKPERAKEALSAIREASREVLADIGVLLRYLRDSEKGPDNQQLSTMPQPGLHQLDRLIAEVENSGLKVDTVTTGELGLLGPTGDHVAYRVIQEGLTNVHKHGSGGVAAVEIEIGPQTSTITVTNPVAEHSRNQPGAPSGNMGLLGLRERLSAIGGSLRHEQHGGTFTLSATFPTTPEHTA